jgi:toxin ParE1/3/4
MARLLRTSQARSDVLDIWEYIARDNPKAADNLVRKLDLMLRRLAEQPGIGAPQEKYRVGLRCFPVGNYLIFYESIPKGIQVIRVLHGARDWPEII